jgi:hypothetical protein
VALTAFEGKNLQRWIKAVFRYFGQRNKIEMPLWPYELCTEVSHFWGNHQNSHLTEAICVCNHWLQHEIT